MKNRKFWNWATKNQEDGAVIRTLTLNGVIASESWFDDDVTPQMFKDELLAGSGDIEVFINSPGGRDGDSNAKIANILEHGKVGQPPKPFLKPAKSATKNTAKAAMIAVLEEETKNI